MKQMKPQIIQENLVKDDCGEYWVFGGNNIRLVGDDSPEGGYPCEDFREAIITLAYFGYLDLESLQDPQKYITPTKESNLVQTGFVDQLYSTPPFAGNPNR